MVNPVPDPGSIPQARPLPTQGPGGPGGPQGLQGPQGNDPVSAIALALEVNMEQGQAQGANFGGIPNDCPCNGDSLNGFPQDPGNAGGPQGGGNILDRLINLLSQLLGLDNQQGGQPAFAGAPGGAPGGGFPGLGGGQAQGQQMNFRFGFAALFGNRGQNAQSAPNAPGLAGGQPPVGGQPTLAPGGSLVQPLPQQTAEPPII